MAATTFQPGPISAAYTHASNNTHENETSPFQKLGFNFLLVFLFLAFSRVFDVKFSFLHITGISYRIVFAMAILSRGFLVALNTKIGRAMLGFTFCFGASVPFSVWRGGSMPVFIDNWLLFSFVAFLATGGLVDNYVQVRKATNALAWGLFVFVIIANVFGTMDNGRLFLSQGKFANPNEMAQALLIGMPLWGAKMSDYSVGGKKLMCVGILVLTLFTVFRTGSRGAMIAFLAMGVFLFLRASVMGKMQIILGVVLLTLLVGATMSGKLISRYKTITEDQIDDDEMDAGMRDSAYASTESRKALLRNSIKFTLRHPLVGVGAGMFPVADNAEAIANGMRKGQWLGTHNSYTQVSSELGIPALGFFIAMIWMSLKYPYRIYKRTKDAPHLRDIGNLALGIHYAMIIYAVTVLFEHIAYTVMLPVFAGLASGLWRVVDAEIERRGKLAPVQVLTAPMFRTYSPMEVAPSA